MEVAILWATIAMLVLANAQQKAPMVLEQTFYDSFGDETSLAYFGGHVMVTCVPQFGDRCDGDAKMELVAPDGKIMGGAKCDPDKGASIRLNVDDDLQFGGYRCRYKGSQATSTESFTVHYHLCSDWSPTCSNTTGCGNATHQVCAVSKTKKSQPCSTIDKEWCKQHATRQRFYYPDGKTTFDSLCEALSQGHRPRARMNFPEPSAEALPKLALGRHSLGFDQPFRLTAQNGVVVVYTLSPPLTESSVTCEVKNRSGNVLPPKHFAFTGRADWNLAALANGSSGIYKLLCAMTGKNNSKAWLSAIAVVLAEGQAKASATRDSTNRYTKSLHCRVNLPHSPDIQVSFTWVGKKRGEIKGPAIFPVDFSDDYHCRATFSYKTCNSMPSPIAWHVESQNIRADADPAPKPTKVATTQTTHDLPVKIPTHSVPPGSSAHWFYDYGQYILAGVGGAIVLFGFIGVMVCVFRPKKKPSGRGRGSVMTKGPSKELLHMANDRKALNLVQLSAWAAERILKETSASKYDDEIRQFEERALMHEKDLAVKGLLCTPAGCRYPNIRTRTDTMVRLMAQDTHKEMPFNAMEDFYRNKILLGQAPTAEGINEHWMMIYQEKVGVIVWVGDLVGPDGAEKIHAYAPMEEGQSGNLKTFRVTALKVIKDEHGCDTYVLDVNPEAGERRQMTLIHISQWPDQNAPPKALAMAKAVIHIASQQVKRASQGLPAVLFHCSEGVQNSVATVVCYIGRQMWMAKGTVDPMGILDYVRRHRYQALAVAADKMNTQLALIGGVLEVICRRATEQMAGQSTTDSKRDTRVFDPQQRKMDLEKAAPKSILLK